MTSTKPQAFHCLTYADADAGLAFLAGIGFEEVVVVRASDDPSMVEHAQLRWRDNGGLMLGSVRSGDPAGADAAGHARCYLVVPSDADVDATYHRAMALGAATVEVPTDQPYGGRVATVSDTEGNHWSFGSYQGE